MSEIDALNSAMLGINRGLTDLRKQAGKIASKTAAEGGASAMDLTRPLVEMKSSALQVKASAKAVKLIDEAIGTLFDDKA